MFGYTLWILLCSWLVCTGWILSAMHQLNAVGYVLSLILFAGIFTWWLRSRSRCEHWIKRGLFFRLRRRFLRPLPLVYLIYLLAALIGGALYAPTNYDALCYRIPRIFHWLSEGHWHWINAWNSRMDYSATGFEWLMLPQISMLRSVQFLFLINVISYALLPGLLYSVFTGLGIRRKVAWYWMWILPCGYCFTLQAGSIGNDCFAAVYFLASAAFALKAVRHRSFLFGSMALFSAGLLTGAKASNLPLLLPLLYLMVPLAGLLFRHLAFLAGVLFVSVAVSFLPMAVLNIIHTGDWSGDPGNFWQMKLKDPVAGLLGNTLEISLGAIAPPVFPAAKAVGKKMDEISQIAVIQRIKKEFPCLNLKSLRELPTEEGGGLGLGITFLLLFSAMGTLFFKGSGKTPWPAVIFGGLSWIALAAYMAKMGSGSAPRLIAVYYIGVIIPVLALKGQGALVRMKWWKSIAVICQLFVLPGVILSPGRPLIPIEQLLHHAETRNWGGALVSRASSVYQVYGSRADNLTVITQQLSPSLNVIGFAGTADESEYSFWKGSPTKNTRRVVDLRPISGQIPSLRGIDCIVGTEWGFQDRYHVKALDFARKVGGVIQVEQKVMTFGSGEQRTWYLVMPTGKNGFQVQGNDGKTIEIP